MSMEGIVNSVWPVELVVWFYYSLLWTVKCFEVNLLFHFFLNSSKKKRLHIDFIYFQSSWSTYLLHYSNIFIIETQSSYVCPKSTSTSPGTWDCIHSSMCDTQHCCHHMHVLVGHLWQHSGSLDISQAEKEDCSTWLPEWPCSDCLSVPDVSAGF